MSFVFEPPPLDLPHSINANSFWGYDLAGLSVDQVATVVNTIADSIEGEIFATGYINAVGGVTHVTGSFLASLTDEQRDGYLAEIETNFHGLLNGEQDYLSSMADGHSSEFDNEANGAQYLAQQAWAYDDAMRANAVLARNLTGVAQGIFDQNPGNSALATHLFAQYLVNSGFGNLVSGYHADGIYNGHYVGGSSGMEGSTIVVTAGRYMMANDGFFGDHATFDFGPHYGTPSGSSHGGDAPPPEAPGHTPTGDVHTSDFAFLLEKDATGNDIPIDPKDMENFKLTLEYLSQSPTAEAMLKIAVANGVKIMLTHDGLTSYNPDTNILKFNPLLGTKEYVGWGGYYNTISPAQAFMHEIGHSIGYTNPIPTNDNFDNTEERRVILGTDAIISSELGAPIRGSHRTDPFDATSPTDFRRAMDQYLLEHPQAPPPPPPPPSNPGYTPPYYDPGSPPPYYDDPNDYR